ncbi:PGPGW domain-containing protein [Pseudohaliea sp.]|uniref:PGPGW domain-containing protein n=1 Tax=Pseudohaliea sp. TaxID=2740289 RepID=UPI0032EFB1C5
MLVALATLLAIPWLVTQLPADYFDRHERQSVRKSEGWLLSTFLLVLLRNLLGAALLGLGVLMLFTPGQGVLTILAGLLVMNFPGKYRLERWLVTRPGVLKSLNGLRKRRGEPPFRLP